MTKDINSSPDGEATPRLAAIILAAGYSSRMGRLKPLLSIAGCTAVEAVVRTYVSAGIPDVFVVLGHRAGELRPIVEAAGARCVLNPNFDQGMFSSVRAGVAALPQCAEACFITPADIPLVRVSTVRQLACCFTTTKKEVIYPVFQERRGHPTLVSRAILAETLETSLDAKLSTLLAAHEAQSCNLFVPDEGIHMDMDTPAELAAVRELAMHREFPTPAECESLLSGSQPGERVARHSRVVAQVAYRLAVALAERGVSVDPALVRAAGLLHDIAKGKPEHAAVGAQLLRNLDFQRVAGVVALHTDYTFNQLDDAAVVYLADKLVSGDRLVGLEQRFQRSMERFQQNPAALASARRRRATAEAIAREIESCLQVDLQQAIGDLPPRGDPTQASDSDQSLATGKARGGDGVRLSRP